MVARDTVLLVAGDTCRQLPSLGSVAVVVVVLVLVVVVVIVVVVAVPGNVMLLLLPAVQHTYNT